MTEEIFEEKTGLRPTENYNSQKWQQDRDLSATLEKLLALIRPKSDGIHKRTAHYWPGSTTKGGTS